MDVIFDLDGTLADVTARVHFVVRPPEWDDTERGLWRSDWKGFFAGIPEDEPVGPLVLTAVALHAAGHRIVLCSGRDTEHEQPTRDWLARHGVPFHALYLRRAGDNRADDVVKRELLAAMRGDGYDPVLVFDDRASVVAMWRAQGLICAQVAPGNF